MGDEIRRAAYPRERAAVMPALVDAPRVQSHAGNFRVVLRLKKREKMVTSATVIVEIRPGIRDL